MRFERTDPAPGDHVPPFDLPTIDGGHLRSDDIGQRPVLLIFGSSTCPVTDNAAPGLNELHRRFGDRVRFVMVNVREAHPGKAFPQPKTMETKTAHATTLQRIYGFVFEIAVDDIDGTLHRAMSPKPNSAYLLAPSGTILFRAQWANDTQALERAIEATIRSQAPQPSESGGILKPTLRMLRNIAPVLDRAGAGAWRDMWLVAPPLAFMAYTLKTLHIRPSPNVASSSPQVVGAARGARG
ncbi:MAG: TlpA family protein disulfide reductase [Vicinamibacterales bacterium]